MQTTISRAANTSRPLGRAPPRVTQAGLTLRPISVLGLGIHTMPIVHTMPFVHVAQCQICNWYTIGIVA